MIAKNILWLILFFFIQPVFIVGLFHTLWHRQKRLKYVRQNYRLNFNPNPFEILDYLFKMVLIGVIISVIVGVVGVPLTIEWYLVYQLVSIILLLISGTRFIHPLFTFSLTSIALFAMDYLDLSIPMGWLKNLTNQEIVEIGFKTTDVSSLIVNSLFFITIILIFTSSILKKKDQNKFYPMLHSSKRGKVVAKYQNKSLFLLPLLIIVPGSVIEPFASWWPLFTIGGESFAVLLLPVLIGFHFTISTQLLENARKNMKKDLQILAMMSTVFLLISYFYKEFSILAVSAILIGGFVVLYRHRQREKMWAFKYGPADEGLRVISVRPKSPAERMDLSIGVIITHINDQEMNNKEEFYETMSYNRSYIRMRVKRSDGEIIMVETPLYDDDFNNLGLLLL